MQFPPTVLVPGPGSKHLSMTTDRLENAANVAKTDYHVADKNDKFYSAVFVTFFQIFFDFTTLTLAGMF